MSTDELILDRLTRWRVGMWVRAGTLVSLWRWPAAGFLGVWFFAILAPSTSIIPIQAECAAEEAYTWTQGRAGGLFVESCTTLTVSAMEINAAALASKSLI